VATTLTSSRDTVEFFTEEQLRERERAVVAELEHRFGSLEAALDQEYTGSYPSEDLYLFSEYHAVRFLLEE